MTTFVPTDQQEVRDLREKYLLNQASCLDRTSEKMFDKFELRQAYEAGLEKGSFYAVFLGFAVGFIFGLFH